MAQRLFRLVLKRTSELRAHGTLTQSESLHEASYGGLSELGEPPVMPILNRSQ